MVNVTKANFLAQLSDFLEYLPSASYVAIDEEMTGISLPETSWSDNKMELPSERYTRCLKGVPERYSVLQVGVSLFHRNPKYNNQRRCEQQEEEMNSLLGKLNKNELEDLLIDHDVMAEEGDDNDDDDDDDDDETEYTARIYNFYLFPKKREMTMNPSTVKFLLDNHMDFDKVFREGIPCATFDEANILKKRYFDRYHAPPPAPKTGNVNGGEENGTTNNQSTPLKKNRVRLTKVDDIAFVARAMAGLREWIDSDNAAMANVAAAVMNDDDTNVAAVVALPDDAAARFANVGGDVTGSTIHHNHNGINTADTCKKEGTSHVLPACNSFLRRYLYETIEDEYPGLILERADIQDASWNAFVIGGGKDQIRVMRLNPVEKELRETRLRREAWDEVLMDCGFATIFHALSDACHGKKFTKRRTRAFLDGMSSELTWSSSAVGRTIPVVVHNGLMDLMFLLTHCHHPTLSENFEDTKRIIQNYFPFVFDTKVIADEYSDAIIKSGSTNLGDLYTVTYGNSFSPNGTNLSLSNTPALIMNQDGKGQGQAHEAAWDAYMTGCVFFALCGRILESRSSEISLDELLHGHSTMDDVRSQLRTLIGANLIYMHRSLYTIDLESSGPITGLFDPLSCGLCFDTTFHVSGITSSVSTRDILRSLWTGNESEEEVIRELKYEIIWVDDASFFVGTRSMSDFHLTVTRGLIASHVRNALHAGLDQKVNILSLKDYFINKNHVVPQSGIVNSLLLLASKPFLTLQSKLGKMMGFGEKRSSEELSGRASKRMKFN